MTEHYIASMTLAGVGDAMGYKNGDWEFCYDGEKIHADVANLGGVSKLCIKMPEFIVSDDTVLLLSTAEALIEVGEKNSKHNVEELYSALAHHYRHDIFKDMGGRAPGMTIGAACNSLKPLWLNGWHIKFNPRGGGCGAAMRSMCIGLRYPNVFDVECLEKLVAVSVESGRMTHNHPTGYLGSFASALFGALAISAVPLNSWGSILVALLPKVLIYIEKAGRDVDENKRCWKYFGDQWKKYLDVRNLSGGQSDPQFPVKYDVADRDIFYKSLAFSSWGGSSGHDAPMIAYDALLFAKQDWTTLCHHGMLHSGDNDSTGVIAGFCYGAIYGFHGVPVCNYSHVEYRKRLEDAGRKLYDLASANGYVNKTSLANGDIPIEKIFENN